MPPLPNTRPIKAWTVQLGLAVVVAILVLVLVVSFAATRETPGRLVTSALPTSTPTPGNTAAVPAASARITTLSGVVTDENGRPVAGATVRLTSGTTNADATTDLAGRYRVSFTFAYPNPQCNCYSSLTVVAERIDFETTVLQRISVGDTERTLDIRLQPRDAIPAGDTTMVSISPNDQVCEQWQMDADEWPCQKVHVHAPTAGTITVSVISDEWLGLQLMREDVRPVDPPCCGARESIDVPGAGDIEVEVLLMPFGFVERGQYFPSDTGPWRATIVTTFAPR